MLLFRNIVSLILLDWHSRCFIFLCEVEAGLKNIIVDGESNLRPSAVIFKKINDIIEENLKLLLVEGFDVLTFNDLALTKIMDICSIQQGSFDGWIKNMTKQQTSSRCNFKTFQDLEQLYLFVDIDIITHKILVKQQARYIRSV